jgi:D-amino-acid oxidase
MSGTETQQAPVVVVGAGVIGLSVATVLAEAGRQVTVMSAEPPERTTSRVAGAVWDSYLCAGPHVLAWATATYHHLASLSVSPDTGVRMTPLNIVARHPLDVPEWAAVAGGALPLPDGVADWVAGGFSCLVPTVDTGAYLPYLVARLQRAGGALQTRRLASLREGAPCGVLINCTGVGARALTGDPTLRPVRGQVVVLANPGIDSTTIDWTVGAEPTYAITHPATVVAGGCAIYDEWSTEPDSDLSDVILSRVTDMVPALRGAAVLGVRVGLRPWRPQVRVEHDPTPPPGVDHLIHCYGHGGAGVTLSWGSALAVADLVSGI